MGIENGIATRPKLKKPNIQKKVRHINRIETPTKVDPFS